MGHYIENKYTIKLNEMDSSYSKIINDIKEEIKQKYIEYKKDPSDSFNADLQFINDKIIYHCSSYKSRVSSHLSLGLMSLIKKNIDSLPDSAYLYQEEAENIVYQYGYAKKVADYLAQAGYSDSQMSSLFNTENSRDKFFTCLHNKEELNVVIREGENTRLKKELKDIIYHVDIPEPYYLYEKVSQESKEWKLNEKWLAYFLINGVDEKYTVRLNSDIKTTLDLKEYLYLMDITAFPKGWGKRLLKDLTSYGISFKEGVEPNNSATKEVSRYLGRELSEVEVDNWYQQNKASIKSIPVLSKETLEYFNENYPTLTEKLNNKLSEFEFLQSNIKKTNKIF